MAGACWRRRSVGGMSVGFGFGHEVSNPAQSVLKLRGPAPRAKVSMRRMRPAQQGQALTGADISERSVVCGALISTGTFWPVLTSTSVAFSTLPAELSPSVSQAVTGPPVRWKTAAKWTTGPQRRPERRASSRRRQSRSETSACHELLLVAVNMRSGCYDPRIVCRNLL